MLGLKEVRMTRKLLGIFTTVVAALLVVGVAWASDDRGPDDSTGSTTATSVGSSSSITSPTSSSTSVTSPNSSSTSVTSSTGSTSVTSSTNSTGTTIDDDDDDKDDDDKEVVVASGGTFQVPGVGSVTIDIVDGRLVLVDVSAPGWDVNVDKNGTDKIEVEFRKGDAEAEFEAELETGRLRIEVEND
jgi:hypothetical protein